MSNVGGRVTKRHIGRKVDFRNEFTNVPGVTLLKFERRGRFDLALIRLPSGKEMFVERHELHLAVNLDERQLGDSGNGEVIPKP